MASICAQCKQKLVGKGFELKGKTYCGGCYSELLEKIEKDEVKKKELGDYLLELYEVSDFPVEVISQIEKLVEQKPIEYIKGLLSYYYNILGNEIKFSDMYYLNRIIEKNTKEYDKYLVEKEEIRKQNEKVDLKNIPVNTIVIKKTTKKTGRKPKYNMEDL